MTKDRDLAIFDIEKRTSDILLTGDEILAFMDQHGLNRSTSPRLVQEWNGKGHDLYLAGEAAQAASKQNWLAKIDRKTKSLQPVETPFPLHRLGHFNESRSLYVHCGEVDTDDRNAVYVRDLIRPHVSTLIQPDKDEKHYSLPAFCGDRIIYIQGNAIWIMDSNGENREQLFPPGR